MPHIGISSDARLLDKLAQYPRLTMGLGAASLLQRFDSDDAPALLYLGGEVEGAIVMSCFIWAVRRKRKPEARDAAILR